MLRVIVNLHAGGLGPAETLAEVEIANITPFQRERGDYRVRVYGKHGRRLPSRDSEVHDHPRLSAPVLTLVRKALEEAGF